MKSGRQWFVGAIVIALACVVGLVLLLGTSKAHVPRLAVVKTAHTGGRELVTFRLDAPTSVGVFVTGSWFKDFRRPEKSRVVALLAPSPRPSLLQAGQGTEHGAQGDAPWLSIGAGESREFCVVAPDERVWQLILRTLEQPTGLEALKARARLVWRTKSPSFWKVDPMSRMAWLESDVITNAAPRAADAIRP